MKDFTNKNILDSLKLPIIENLDDLEESISINKKLLYFLSKESNMKKYNTFYIVKKNGSKREINEPVYSLKIIQKWILENILYNMKISKNSFGFRHSNMGSPLVENAKIHKDNDFILKMDLKNFYPSIKRDKVFYLFKNIGYNNYISNVLTNLCTYKDVLPQGAVTSPYISNLICYKLDYRIDKYCVKREISYTRYADDLMFSGNNRDVLRSIYGMILIILRDEGFKCNKDKTFFMTPKGRKKIIGITVNDKLIKAPKEMKRLVRSMIHNAIISCDYSKIDIIRGYISYIDSVEKGYKDRLITYINSFKDKSICVFQDVVESYNTHKFYKECIDFELMNPEKYVSYYYDLDDFYDSIFHDRDKFLFKRGFIKDELEENEDSTIEDYEDCPF